MKTSRNILLLVILVTSLLLLGLLGLKVYADQKGPSYIAASKKHYSDMKRELDTLNAEWIPVILAADERTKNAGLSPSENDKLTVPPRQEHTKKVLDIVKRAHASQPQLDFVPFGKLLSPEYKRAADGEVRLQEKFGTFATKSESAAYYYANHSDLAATLTAIGDIATGMQVNQMLLTRLAGVANDAELDSAQVRGDIADGIKQGNTYVDAYKKQVAKLPLPPEYAQERSSMIETADAYASLTDRLANAYEKRDSKEMSAVYDELRKDRDRYDFLSATVKPYSDPDKLKNPYTGIDKSYEDLKQTIGSL